MCSNPRAKLLATLSNWRRYPILVCVVALCYHSLAMTADPKPPSDEVVVAALRSVATTKGRLLVHPRCQDDMVRERFDLPDACDLVAACSVDEIHKNEPDYDPDRLDQIVVLRIELEDGYDLYVKIALQLPELTSGYFLSFKPWID